MAKVYIVTSGKYSDYRISGVFTTEKLAQGFIDAFDDETTYDFMIEVWELDAQKEYINKGYKAYFVRMSKEGTGKGEISDSSYGFVSNDSWKKYGFDVRGNLYNHCFAKDEAHALKITNELRAQLIATNKWGKKNG